MKRHSIMLVSVLLILALALSACTAPVNTTPAAPEEKAAQATDTPAPQEPTATPVSQEPTATPEVEVETETESETEPEQEIEDSPVFSLAEAGITSYRQHLVNETTEDDLVTTIDMLIEYDAQGPAMRTLMSSSDDNQAFESIVIGDVTYMRNAEEEWIALQIQGLDMPQTTLALLNWADETGFINSESCEYQGNETVEGQETRHYQCDDAYFMGENIFEQYTGFVLDEGSIDYYVSTEYDITVKSIVNWEGQAEGVNYTNLTTITVTDINEPISIEAPTGVDAPGAAEDIPLPDNAVEMTAMTGMVSFTVPDAMEDVVDWYEDAMPGEGWTIDSDGSMVTGQMAMQSWNKDDRKANLMISAGEGVTTVVITVE